jgi:S-adenosylmethionine synthetase
MYYGNFKVKSVLEKIQQDSEIDPKSKRAIWESLRKRLYVDEVRVVRREHVTMVRKDGKTTVTVAYETRDVFIGNLFIGATFSDSVVIDR